MGKSVGFLKKLKQIMNLTQKNFKPAMTWLKDNIYKPLKPLLQTGLDMAGYGDYNNLLDAGEKIADNVFGKSDNTSFKDSFMEPAIEFGLSTQRLSSAPKVQQPKISTRNVTYSKLF